MKERSQAGSLGLQPQAGLFSGEYIKGQSPCLWAALCGGGTTPCVTEWPFMKWNFFVTAIIKCFPSNFSALTRSISLPAPPQKKNHPLWPLRALDNSLILFVIFIPRTWNSYIMVNIPARKEEAKEGRRAMSEHIIMFWNFQLVILAFHRLCANNQLFFTRGKEGL